MRLRTRPTGRCLSSRQPHELHLGGKEGHMHAPFIFALVERAGTIDHDFALPQREQPAV